MKCGCGIRRRRDAAGAGQGAASGGEVKRIGLGRCRCEAYPGEDTGLIEQKEAEGLRKFEKAARKRGRSAEWNARATARTENADKRKAPV